MAPGRLQAEDRLPGAVGLYEPVGQARSDDVLAQLLQALANAANGDVIAFTGTSRCPATCRR